MLLGNSREPVLLNHRSTSKASRILRYSIKVGDENNKRALLIQGCRRSLQIQLDFVPYD